jgi:hypothetical protein
MCENHERGRERTRESEEKKEKPRFRMKMDRSSRFYKSVNQTGSPEPVWFTSRPVSLSFFTVGFKQ